MTLDGFKLLLARIERINKATGEVFKDAHKLNNETKGEVEEIRELAGLLSAAYYDLIKAEAMAKRELERRHLLSKPAPKTTA